MDRQPEQVRDKRSRANMCFIVNAKIVIGGELVI